MNVPDAAVGPESFDLSGRYRVGPGPAVLTGVQAIARMLIEVRAQDLRAGRRVGVFVSGYPGSPLTGLDLTLARVPGLRHDHDIHLWPAVNEELAATAVWGSQTISDRMGPTRDGVIGVWYGKSPGFDRSGDAMRHGNVQGAHPSRGVLVLVGDDPCASPRRCRAVASPRLPN
jgi:indolepyruvate ferredoxin oxidoreductase